MNAPLRELARRTATIAAGVAAVFAALAGLPASQASATDVYYHSHLNVATIDGGAAFTGTVAESVGLMATGQAGAMGNAIKVGTVRVGPVPAHAGAQYVQVDKVLNERWLPSWNPRRILAQSTRVDFASGSAPADYVGIALQPIAVRSSSSEANYYTVQYELHWYSDTGVLLDEATILPDADQTEYQCGITACSVTADGLHM